MIRFGPIDFYILADQAELLDLSQTSIVYDDVLLDAILADVSRSTSHAFAARLRRVWITGTYRNFESAVTELFRLGRHEEGALLMTYAPKEGE